jgi:hypothetical protein
VGLEFGHGICGQKNGNLMKWRGTQCLWILILSGQMAAHASNLDTIGVTLLQAVTTNVNGAGIRVAQPEAGYGTATNWEVNPGAGGVGQPVSLFTYFSSSGTANNFPNAVGAESGHADAVAGYFYGIPGGRFPHPSLLFPQITPCRCPRPISTTR